MYTLESEGKAILIKLSSLCGNTFAPTNNETFVKSSKIATDQEFFLRMACVPHYKLIGPKVPKMQFLNSISGIRIQRKANNNNNKYRIFMGSVQEKKRAVGAELA